MAETHDWIDEPTSSSSDEDMAYMCLMANIQEREDFIKGSSSTAAADLPSTSKDAKDLVKPNKVNNLSSLFESDKVQAYDSLSVDLYNARSAKKKADLEIKSLTSQLHKCMNQLKDFDKLKNDLKEQKLINNVLNKEKTKGLGHRQIWYLDSGCSRHMIGNKSLLINYVSEPGPAVTFGDNSRGTTKGYGVLSNGSVTFNRVAYVDGLKHNLLSISQLCDLNFIVKFEENQCTILDSSGKKVLTGIRKDNVYVINMDSSSPSDANICFYSESTTDQNWLWHKRLSHLNFKTINYLSSKDLVIGLPKMSYVKVKLCEYILSF
ncbi:uncharacterized protein LOC112514096 [Cynara cardunculus var. scolymus]|uniref:uncharacterized protein LOC112514096 n=1 Tax=Cynara cardunculus var. scolymus TaxID=59895 RepID=UPI000D62F9FB|nr:uncharacterized protein LOC112514096 [Cynara cardunculus var. scolymus]